MVPGPCNDRRFQTVHFDTDSATIRASEVRAIEHARDCLDSFPHDNVSIEGHTDERGEEDYNQTLGERQAAAVRDYLVDVLGVDPERLSIISRGENQPLVPGHDETAWRQNRRVEFVWQ